MSVSESSSMMNIALSQATKPLESAMVDLKFLAGGGAAALRYWLWGDFTIRLGWTNILWNRL